MKLEDYAFPVPPVCTAKWTESDWLQWAQGSGRLITNAKPRLADAAGKFLHAEQNAPLSPFAIQSDGIRYQDLSAEDFAPGKGGRPLFRVSPEKGAAWGSGSYAVAADGTLTLACFSYDSSD
jgi:hypothetical protein